jgi:hypothetical protein
LGTYLGKRKRTQNWTKPKFLYSLPLPGRGWLACNDITPAIHFFLPKSIYSSLWRDYITPSSGRTPTLFNPISKLALPSSLAKYNAFYIEPDINPMLCQVNKYSKSWGENYVVMSSNMEVSDSGENYVLRFPSILSFVFCMNLLLRWLMNVYKMSISQHKPYHRCL